MQPEVIKAYTRNLTSVFRHLLEMSLNIELGELFASYRKSGSFNQFPATNLGLEVELIYLRLMRRLYRYTVCLFIE